MERGLARGEARATHIRNNNVLTMFVFDSEILPHLRACRLGTGSVHSAISASDRGICVLRVMVCCRLRKRKNMSTKKRVAALCGGERARST